MKPKNESQWTGNVYSHDSGDTYYGRMALKGSDTLRVEACALGRFIARATIGPDRHADGETDHVAADIVRAAVVAAGV